MENSTIHNCKIGKGTIIHHKNQVNLYDCVIGKDCNIASFVEIGAGVEIGDRCSIAKGAFIPSGVTIGNDCFIGPHVCFTNDKYPPSDGKHWENIIVGNGVAIGANSTILPGVTLGDCCLVGAGTLVTENVPPMSIVKNQVKTVITKWVN